MKIISLVNQKGGVGKTTVAVNLAAALSIKFNKKVLLIDMDPQGDASNYSGVEASEESTTIDFLLKEKLPITKAENYDVIATDILLADFEMMASATLGREFILKKRIEKYDLENTYDYIIIDCPPAFGLLSTNSIVASDMVITPVTLEHFSIRGIVSLFKTLDGVEELINKNLIRKIVINSLNNSFKHHTETLDEINQYISNFKMDTEIKQDVVVSRSQKVCQNIFAYKENAKTEESYTLLAKEVISYE